MAAKHLLKVKSNKQIADEIFELKLEGNYDLQDFLPGKFLHIKCSNNLDPLLRRPMSICNIDDEGKIMTVLYRRQGAGTKELASRDIGEIVDILAPLGTEFDETIVKPGQKIILVGGGIGVPPLYYLGRKLKAKGARIESILGFNSAKDVFYEKDFANLGKCQIATVDGTYGHKGFVTELLNSDWDILYSCGPTPMLKAVQKLVPENKPAFISLEERMGCGVGACLACICKPSSTAKFDKNYLRACTEGPVFNAKDVVLL